MASILSAGTSSGTALNLTGDTSGILQLASNNGTVGLTMDTSQNIGIGTSSPSTYSNQKLVVYNNGIAAASGSGLTSGKFEVFSNGQTNNQITLSQGFATTDNIGYLYNRANAAFVFGTNNTEAMRIDSSGNVGIGISSPAVKLDVGGNGQFTASSSQISFIDSSNSNYKWSIQGTSSAVRFYDNTASAERMRIDSSGNLLVNTTSAIQGGKISLLNGPICTLNGGAGFSANLSTSTGDQFYFRTGSSFSGGTLAGYITCATSSTTAYVTTSDYRLKKNVAPMTGALEKVTQLKPVTYTWISDGVDSQGFIAHELQAVVPECVIGKKDQVNEDGSIKPQGIDTSFLVATLTAAIQEQQTIITDLKARIETLEKK